MYFIILSSHSLLFLPVNFMTTFVSVSHLSHAYYKPFHLVTVNSMSLKFPSAELTNGTKTNTTFSAAWSDRGTEFCIPVNRNADLRFSQSFMYRPTYIFSISSKHVDNVVSCVPGIFSSTKGNAYTDKRGIGNISYSRGLNFMFHPAPPCCFWLRFGSLWGAVQRDLNRQGQSLQNTGREMWHVLHIETGKRKMTQKDCTSVCEYVFLLCWFVL